MIKMGSGDELDFVEGNEMENKKALKLLYGGSSVFCGAIAGIWAFTANRFQISESLLVVIGGMIAGIGLGMVCHGMSVLVKR